MRVTASRRCARVRPERRGAHEKNARRDGLRGLGLHLRRREDAARLPRADRGGSESRGGRRRGGHRLQPGGPRARGLGDGGYAAAVADAKARAGATQLADVRADTTFFNILFLYDKACTRVTATAVR